MPRLPLSNDPFSPSTRFRCLSTSRTLWSSKQKSHYDSLGIPPNSDAKKVKKAFYKLSMQYHPDKQPNNAAAHKKFLEINSAYSILSDEKAKQQYDNELAYRQAAAQAAAQQSASGAEGHEGWKYPRDAPRHRHRDINVDYDNYSLFKRRKKRPPRVKTVYGGDNELDSVAHFMSETAKDLKYNAEEFIAVQDDQHSVILGRWIAWGTLLTAVGLFVFTSGWIEMIFMDDQNVEEIEWRLWMRTSQDMDFPLQIESNKNDVR